jgi:hypothetical protein
MFGKAMGRLVRTDSYRGRMTESPSDMDQAGHDKLEEKQGSTSSTAKQQEPLRDSSIDNDCRNVKMDRFTLKCVDRVPHEANE